MGRIAVVTGGTRGIGATIALHLKGSGHGVAATYVGNDAAAAAFHRETGGT
jgi:acetoacetyl-CoA reductase